MYCPNCLNEIDQLKRCSACEFELSIIKPFVTASRLNFQQALKSFSERDYSTTSEQIQLALKSYPYFLDELEFALLFFLYSGEYEKSVACLQVLTRLSKHKLVSRFQAIVKEHTDRYNQILDFVNQEKYQDVLALYSEDLDSLSLKEIMLLWIAAKKSNSIYREKIEPYRNRKPQKRGESGRIRIKILLAIATVIAIMLLGSSGLYFQRSVAQESRIENLISEKRGGKELNSLLLKLNTTADHDSVWNRFKQLPIDSSFKVQLHWSGEYFYWEGRGKYLEKDYKRAAEYYERSYKLSSVGPYSDDALYYKILCLMKLNDESQSEHLSLFIEKFQNSNYWDDSISYLFHRYAYIEGKASESKKLVALLEDKQGDSPFLSDLKNKAKSL